MISSFDIAKKIMMKSPNVSIFEAIKISNDIVSDLCEDEEYIDSCLKECEHNLKWRFK